LLSDGYLRRSLEIFATINTRSTNTPVADGIKYEIAFIVVVAIAAATTESLF
tara:strand:+ start:1988 stop:2143 length:156 start_codon:yes stop_codon:yes gene_type:complete